MLGTSQTGARELAEHKPCCLSAERSTHAIPYPRVLSWLWAQRDGDKGNPCAQEVRVDALHVAGKFTYRHQDPFPVHRGMDAYICIDFILLRCDRPLSASVWQTKRIRRTSTAEERVAGSNTVTAGPTWSFYDYYTCTHRFHCQYIAGAQLINRAGGVLSHPDTVRFITRKVVPPNNSVRCTVKRQYLSSSPSCVLPGKATSADLPSRR